MHLDLHRLGWQSPLYDLYFEMCTSSGEFVVAEEGQKTVGAVHFALGKLGAVDFVIVIYFGPVGVSDQPAFRGFNLDS
eukprot:SAG11_NODE_1408_length_4998_cov_19.780772_4_plen_78_part_00